MTNKKFCLFWHHSSTKESKASQEIIKTTKMGLKNS